MIIVTGGTGQLGRAIVQNLVQFVNPSEVGVSVRDLGKASDLVELGVHVRQGDFSQPESLLHAFEDVDQLLIVSSNAASYGADPLVQHRAAIDAARASGVSRIVYTSHMAANTGSAFPPARDHAATEKMLSESGVAWTALRNGFYASSGLFLMGDAIRTGVISAPLDGKVSWTAHADLARAAARILVSKDSFHGPTPPLTGSESLNLTDFAEVLSLKLGRPVRREVITDEAFKEQMLAQKVPPAFLNTSVGLYQASRDGEFETVDSTLEEVLTRKPISIRDLIAMQASSD